MFEDTRALTVPLLAITLVAVAIELTISHKRDLKLYQRKDTLCNLFILLVSRISQPLFLGYIYGSLRLVQALRPFQLSENMLTNVIALVLTDFAYYWEHRLSHKLKPLWFFHEVHHSSKQFNYTTSFRLHWLGRLTAPIIFAPLVLIGFKAEQVLLFFIINLFYQFFLHTKLVGQLGRLEGIINTPSAHRVHHARNQIYIDKNFGGILMVWDRIFGTYQDETATPKFGILGKFESNNPLTVQFHQIPYYANIAKALKSIPVVSTLTSVLAMVALQHSVSAQSNSKATEEMAADPVQQSSAPPQEEAHLPVQTPLKGAVEFAQTKAPDYTGLWKGHVIEFHRHPKVLITEQIGNQVNGTYSGLLGKFPLTGLVDQINETVRFTVDFSGSKLARWKKRDTVLAVFNGSIKNEVISGIASIPEFGDRSVHFEAKKLVKVQVSKSTTDQTLQ